MGTKKFISQRKYEYDTIMRVSKITLGVNILLTIFKLIAGIMDNSTAMVTDSVHTISDILSTIAVMIGTQFSYKKPDNEHPYGYERYESITAVILSVTLFVTGIGIGFNAVRKTIMGVDGTLETPGILALIAAAVSILTKEWMYQYTKKPAKEINSDALMADAWHHRSDAFSSIGSLVGIMGARIGYPMLDPIAGIVISLFIIRAAYDIFKDATTKITDHSLDEQTISIIKNIALDESGVWDIISIKTRQYGPRAYVDIEIAVDGNQTILESQEIIERVKASITSKVKHILDVNVWAFPAQILTDK